MDFPYGMLMNYPKGQVGPLVGVVGTNVVINPTYGNPITSVPQSCSVQDWVDNDQLRELAGFKAPYTT